MGRPRAFLACGVIVKPLNFYAMISHKRKRPTFRALVKAEKDEYSQLLMLDSMRLNKAIARQIRAMRMERGMTLAEFAEKTSIPANLILYSENEGTTRHYQVTHLLLAAEVLGCTLEEMIPWIPHDPQLIHLRREILCGPKEERPGYHPKKERGGGRRTKAMRKAVIPRFREEMGYQRA